MERPRDTAAQRSRHKGRPLARGPKAAEVRSELAGSLSRRNTASHRCILAAQGAPPQPGHKKTGGSPADPPVKNLDTDFLRRHYPHQVKGRSWSTSSQPAYTSSPVFLVVTPSSIHAAQGKCKTFASAPAEGAVPAIPACAIQARTVDNLGYITLFRENGTNYRIV